MCDSTSLSATEKLLHYLCLFIMAPLTADSTPSTLSTPVITTGFDLILQSLTTSIPTDPSEDVCQQWVSFPCCQDPKNLSFSVLPTHRSLLPCLQHLSYRFLNLLVPPRCEVRTDFHQHSHHPPPAHGERCHCLQVLR